MNPEYPIFVPTKGRHQTRHTIKALEAIGVPYKAVVEPQEFGEYSDVIDKSNLLTVPHQDKGLVTTRNWIWDYAQAMGVKRYWTFDDNIRAFHRLTKNKKHKVQDGTFLKVMEDFTNRYSNVVISGMNYEMFIPRKTKVPPFLANTRVYSNMLIETSATDRAGEAFRNEGFFNDDTDLCLRVLKQGFCTIQFNCFLIDKIATMVVNGGMTPYYQDDGRWKMAEELQRKHPDVTTATKKWGRYQHYVDYRRFKANKLIRKDGVEVKKGIDNYGMRLVMASDLSQDFRSSDEV